MRSGEPVTGSPRAGRRIRSAGLAPAWWPMRGAGDETDQHQAPGAGRRAVPAVHGV